MNKVQIKGATHQGLKRQLNEDYFFINEEKSLAILCDGVGGENAGEVASKKCVEIIHECLLSNISNHIASENDVRNIIQKAVSMANDEIFKSSQANTEQKGMATTLVLAIALKNKCFIAHVGDSRAYLVRGSSTTQLTKDHSLINELIREGQLNEDSKNNFPYKNILTKAIGKQEYVKTDIISFDYMKNDRLVLCSDGLGDYLDDLRPKNSKKISEVLSTDNPTSLIDYANSCGGKDNVTAVNMYFKADDTEQKTSQKLQTLSQIPLFEEFSYKELLQLIEIVEVKKIKQDFFVFKEGDKSSSMYVIIEGELEVYVGDTSVRKLHKKDYFGEISLFSVGKRTASIKATKNSLLLVISREKMMGLINVSGSICRKLCFVMIDSLAKKLVDVENKFFKT